MRMKRSRVEDSTKVIMIHCSKPIILTIINAVSTSRNQLVLTEVQRVRKKSTFLIFTRTATTHLLHATVMALSMVLVLPHLRLPRMVTGELLPNHLFIQKATLHNYLPNLLNSVILITIDYMLRERVTVLVTELTKEQRSNTSLQRRNHEE